MIIYGSRLRSKVLGQISYVCDKCHQNAYHTVVSSQRWFTLFFIPIFPYSKRYSSRCNVCGIQLTVPKEWAEGAFAAPAQQPQQVAAGQMPGAPAQPMNQQYPGAPAQPVNPQASASYYDQQLRQQ